MLTQKKINNGICPKDRNPKTLLVGKPGGPMVGLGWSQCIGLIEAHTGLEPLRTDLYARRRTQEEIEVSCSISYKEFGFVCL
jgi:hypothetical protein